MGRQIYNNQVTESTLVNLKTVDNKTLPTDTNDSSKSDVILREKLQTFAIVSVSLY